jgi:two-component system, NarL family, sensor histidine kinase DesK
MTWLARVVAFAIVPVFVGALQLLIDPRHSDRDLAVGVLLLLLCATHVFYWQRPWPSRQGRALVAATAMVVINFVLLDVLGFMEPLLGFTQPLLWLYPALIIGAGLGAPVAAIGVGLTALAAAVPKVVDGMVMHTPSLQAEPFGSGHSILLSIVLAGLGMSAVRQLIEVNAALHTARAELAELAVARERDRLARELHDLLGRTLSLIAVKAELASRLSARADPSAETELADVQRLARQAVRDVREAVAGPHTPSFDAELIAAEAALRTAGIHVTLDKASASIDPAHETTVAWALREAVTNVVKHSGARACHIALATADGRTTLEVDDDGRGPVGDGTGTGLAGLAERIQAVGGTLQVGPNDGRGFSLQVRLGGDLVPGTREAVAT